MALENLILWKPLQKATLILYAGVFLLALPAPQAATLLLFAIVALWSRIPALMTVFTKDVEVVDFFTVIIALNIGPLTGALFGSGIILFSRIFGPTEDLDYTFKESICFFVGAFVSHGAYAFTGANVMITMFSFTFVRYGFYLVLDLLTTPNKVFFTMIILLVSAPIAIISNVLLVNLFGGALERIFQKGVAFSWELLIFVSAAIAVFFFISKFMFREEQKRVETFGTPGASGTSTDSFAGGMLSVPEPHEAFFSIFMPTGFGSFFYATPKLFNGFVTAILFVLLLVGSFQVHKPMGFLHMALTLIGVFALVEALTWLLEKSLAKRAMY